MSKESTIFHDPVADPFRSTTRTAGLATAWNMDRLYSVRKLRLPPQEAALWSKPHWEKIENHEFDSVEKVTREFFVSPANSQDTSLITGMIRFDFYDYD